jgi:hypothetical protein
VRKSQLGIAVAPALLYNPAMPKREKLSKFVEWTRKHITGDENGQA